MPFVYANVRYRTNAERLARVLPPGVVPGAVPEVMVDHLVIDFGDRKNRFFDAPYLESAVWVRCRLEDADADADDNFFLLTMPLTGEWGRTAGRETLALSKKDGHVTIEREGDRVRASLTRRGALVYELDGAISDRAAPEVDWMRETRDGGLGLRFRHHPDWRQSVLDERGMELVRLGPGGTTRPSDAAPDEAHDEESVARALVLDDTTFRFGTPDVTDPWSELPVLELLGGSFFEKLGFDYNFGSRRPQRKGDPVIPLAPIPAEEADAWAFWGHDRPLTGGEAWVPEGWPEQRSAVTLTGDEVDRYQGRDHLAVEGQAVDVTLGIDAELHRSVVPAELDPGDAPEIRVLAVDAERSDVSVARFQELWLLARTATGWYALSHIVTPDGDVLFGRETFGYPSKLGQVGIEVTADAATVSGERLLRRFAEVRVEVSDARPAEVAESFDLHGVQPDPFSLPQPVAGRIVAQPWRLFIEGSEVAADAIQVSFPDDAGPSDIGRPDAWFDFTGAVPLRAVVGSVRIERGPGEIVTEVDDVLPLIRDRIEMSWAVSRITEPVTSTFRIK